MNNVLSGHDFLNKSNLIESKSQYVPRKRRYYEENDLDGFIDDSEYLEVPENDISTLISQITGYNPNSEKYANLIITQFLLLLKSLNVLNHNGPPK